MRLSGNSTPPPTAGRIHGTTLKLLASVSVTNLHVSIAVAGASLTAGQCFAGLWREDRSLVGVSADLAAAFATTGFLTIPLIGGPYALPAGRYYAGLFFNGTTGPGLLRGPNFSVVNSRLAAADSIAWYADSGRTTSMPSTLGAFTAHNMGVWFGLS